MPRFGAYCCDDEGREFTEHWDLDPEKDRDITVHDGWSVWSKTDWEEDDNSWYESVSWDGDEEALEALLKERVLKAMRPQSASRTSKQSVWSTIR